MYLEIQGFKKSIDGKPLFSGVDISMDKGGVITLIGNSGCGKSTFLRMLAGVSSVDGGSFFLDGVNMESLPKGKRPLSIMFQEALLFPHMNVIDNVCFPLKCRGINKKDRYAKGEGLLKRLGLGELLKRRSFELSGGEKQRVSLARAIISSPKLLLLDEPFASLDLKLSRDIRSWMKDVIVQNGITTIFVTHSQEDALVMSPRVFIMDGGTVKESDLTDRQKFFGEEVCIDGEFIPVTHIEINHENGIAITIDREIMLHGEEFIIFMASSLGGKEIIMKKPADIIGKTAFIRKRR